LSLTMKSISHILLLSLVIVGLVPLGVMTVQGYHCASEALLEEAEMHMQTVVRSRAHELEQWFSERVGDVAAVASDPLLRQALSQWSQGDRTGELREITRFLDASKREFDSYVTLCLIDLDGQELACAAGGEHRPEGLLGRELLEELLAGQKVVFGHTHLHSDGLAGVHVAAIVHDSDDRPLAIVAGLLSIAPRIDQIMLDPVGLQQTGRVFLVDEDGRLASGGLGLPRESIFTFKVDTLAARQALAGQVGTEVYRDERGREVIGAFMPAPRIGGALIAEMETGEALKGLAIYRHNAAWIGGATLVLLIVLSVLISRHLSRPIVQLTEATGRVAQGDLDYHIDIVRRDEVGQLASSFNQMTASLKEAQDKLVRRETLAAIGELSSSVVHEMRNPLSSVKMSLQLIQRQLKDTPKLSEHVRIGLEQALRLERMLSELLQYGRPAQLELRRQPARAVFDEAVTLARQTVGEEGCELEIAVQDGDRPIEADAPKLSSALANLLCNAAQAQPKDKAVHFSLATAELRGRPAVAFTVEDLGVGISAENMAELFRPFFSTREKGTGLGLANAKKVVEAHRGTINVHSTVGAGSTFRVILPVEDDAHGRDHR